MLKFIQTFTTILLLTVCNAQVPVSQNVSSNPLTTTLDSFINKKADSILTKQNLTGILVAVNEGGRNKYYSFGYADAERKTVFDSLTIVEIGSITKTFTAYVLLKVLAEKNISDRASIISYLPKALHNNKSLEKITFLSLLNHTSGLTRMPSDIDATITNPLQPYENYTEENLFDYLKELDVEPTTTSNYSNTGAGLAGVLAARISGLSYEELLNKYIHIPLSMDAKAVLTTQESNNKAVGKMQQEIAEYWNMNALAPAGGIKYKAHWLMQYLQAISMPNKDNEAIVDSLTTPTVTLNASMQVARAWHTLSRKDKPTIYWHNGGTYGFSTFCGFVKGTSKMVFVVINEFNKNNFSDGLGMAILNKMLN